MTGDTHGDRHEPSPGRPRAQHGPISVFTMTEMRTGTESPRAALTSAPITEARLSSGSAGLGCIRHVTGARPARLRRVRGHVHDRTGRPQRCGCTWHWRRGPSACSNTILVGRDLAEARVVELLSARLYTPDAASQRASGPCGHRGCAGWICRMLNDPRVLLGRLEILTRLEPVFQSRPRFRHQYRMILHRGPRRMATRLTHAQPRCSASRRAPGSRIVEVTPGVRVLAVLLNRHGYGTRTRVPTSPHAFASASTIRGVLSRPVSARDWNQQRRRLTR
jgi:hypothetical protein